MSKNSFLNKSLVSLSQVFRITQASHAHISALPFKAPVAVSVSHADYQSSRRLP